MIIALRSCLVCEDLAKRPDGRVDYIGVAGDTITAQTRPGMRKLVLALLVELDGERTVGRLQIQAEGYDQTFPFRVPAAVTTTGLLLELVLPILKEGALTVRVIDEGRGGKTLRSQFKLRFGADADMLEPSAADEFRRLAEDAAESTRADLTARSLH